MVSVVFEYDEESTKWEMVVTGAKNETEAKQAFNAVVLTCRDVVVSMEHKVERVSIGEYVITPVVTLEGLYRSKIK